MIGDDVVIASRYVRGGGYVNFPLQRTWGSNLVNIVLSVFFHVRGITDYTIFYRAYRADAVQQRSETTTAQTSSPPSPSPQISRCCCAFCPSATRFSEVPLLYDYGLKKSQSKMNPFKTLREYQGLIVKRLLRKI